MSGTKPLRTPDTALGLPESALSPHDRDTLPAEAPPAPWTCRARALVWVQRAPVPEFAWTAPPLPLAVVTFVDYLDTPVGRYREVAAAAPLRPRRGGGWRPSAQIPFIAVDSLPSVLGGRVNWALPKTTARFDGDLATGHAEAVGQGWSAAVAPVAGPARRVPALPFALRFHLEGPLGRSGSTFRGRARPLVVRSEVTGPTLPGWLVPGRHLALAFDGTLRIDAPA